MLLATLPRHLCHIWSRARFNRLCDGQTQSNICELNHRFCSFFLWTVRMFGRPDLLFEHGALLVRSTLRVWVGGVLYCVVVQVGDQGNWRWMTGRISGAALTVILVLRFHVCLCGLPPHLVPPQPATHMRAYMLSDSKRYTHLYAFTRV